MVGMVAATFTLACKAAKLDGFRAVVTRAGRVWRRAESPTAAGSVRRGTDTSTGLGGTQPPAQRQQG